MAAAVAAGVLGVTETQSCFAILNRPLACNPRSADSLSARFG